ncbi:MAG: caspase family protein [Armatimonadetes bacterium]|nr:caspase family protein [Armatimonadota bacterium]
MAKKAACVGINDYPYDGSDLNGCVNDAAARARLLVDHYDFADGDVRLILDAAAAKAPMVSALKDHLLAGAQSGDALAFTNSSHGSCIPDTSGDEPMYGEILCPYDVADNALTDDDLREMFAGLPQGVRLTVISDSCLSGTVTRAAAMDNLPDIKVPGDRRVCFLSPALRGLPVLEDPFKAAPKRRVKRPESRMKEILLSGSTDRKCSYDALIGGAYHGAMTCFALQAIRAANYTITCAQLRSRLNYLLDDSGYPQRPRLEGKSRNKKRPLFL